ncbi:MAG: alpha/beta hydrolase [Bacteroidota bacterium]
MNVQKEMYDKELQAQYGQFRFIIAMNSRNVGLKLMNGVVRMTKGQKIKEAVNETHFVPSSMTKGHQIRTRVFRPEGATKPLPAMVYFHGGGYMMGIPEMANVFYADVLKRRDIVIVSPDYRLSQKDPFPAGFNDCYDTLLWVRDHAQELNIDPNNIIIAGHSAGGGMAAAITLKARDTRDVKPIFQMPIYPMLDHRMTTASSKMLGSAMWDGNINAIAWKRYLRDIKGEVPAYASPMLNKDYSDFPPTISFVGDLEPFYDENVAYIEALKAADIPVKFKIFEGGYHGFEVGSPDTTLGKEANNWQLDAFEEFYDRYAR